MAEQILVPLKRHDRIEEIIPYLEKVAKAGMRVVFLIRYPVDSWLYLRDHWMTTESSREAMLAGRKITDHYSWDVQRGLAEQKTSLARRALQERGIEVGLEVYTGSWRRLMDDYKANGDVHLIVMQAGNHNPIARLVRRIMRLFVSYKAPHLPPVFLLHPGEQVGAPISPDPTKSDWLDIASSASCKGEDEIDPHPRTLTGGEVRF